MTVSEGIIRIFQPLRGGGGGLRDGKFYCDSISGLNPEKKTFPLFGKARIRMKGKMNITKN